MKLTWFYKNVPGYRFMNTNLARKNIKFKLKHKKQRQKEEQPIKKEHIQLY